MLPRRRKSTRLQDFDYSSPGAYFVTLATQDRNPFFGRIVGEIVVLSEIGDLARTEWIKSGDIRKEIRLDEFIVMPNHLHALLFIDYLENGRDTFISSHRDTLALRAHGPRRRHGGSLGTRSYGEIRGHLDP